MEKDIDECVICISDLNQGNLIRSLECGHRYHSKCISEWMLAKPLVYTCPCCNREFPIETTINIDTEQIMSRQGMNFTFSDYIILRNCAYCWFLMIFLFTTIIVISKQY
jgi:hypothetical protein